MAPDGPLANPPAAGDNWGLTIHHFRSFQGAFEKILPLPNPPSTTGKMRDKWGAGMRDKWDSTIFFTCMLAELTLNIC